MRRSAIARVLVGVFLAGLCLLMLGAIVYRDRLSLEWHKWCLRRAAGAMASPIDKARSLIGLAPRDPLDVVWSHQAPLIEAGFLGARRVSLSRAVDLSEFTTNAIASQGGEYGYVWLGDMTNLTMVATADQVDAFAKWVLDRQREK